MFLRPCLLVPVFDNPLTLRKVVEDLLKETVLPIIVIDDGSEVPASSLLDPHPRVLLHRFSENRGKGMALEAGFNKAVSLGYTHALTFDADGQHLATEVNKLLKASEADPWALIIGKRNLKDESVPPISRFGRAFSNFWVKYKTEFPIQDSQSGLRLYPLFPLQTLKFFTKKYDFEIEVLIRLLWRKIKVKEVEVEVAYSATHRVSHFKKGRDNLRISLLNTVLVFISLLSKNRSPKKAALAVALGVLVGTTPFYGFHSLIALGLCLLLRLNFIYCWVGTQVSLPFFAPFLTIASVHIGKHYAEHFFSEWLTGSLILGVGLGIFFGLVTYFLSSTFTSQRKTSWTGQMRGGKFGNWFLKKVGQTLGLRAAYSCLYFIVPYFYFFSPTGRKGSLEYLKVLYPEASWLKLQGFILKHYFEFGKVLLDRLYQNTVPGKHFKTISRGAEYIGEYLETEKAVILMTAHVGSWTLAAHHMVYKEKGEVFQTVEFGGEGTTLAARSEKIRNILTNQLEHSVLHLKKVLEEGKPIGIMGDRPRSKRYEIVPFLGKLAVFDSSPFLLAATLQVPVLFTFGFREKDGEYRFFAEPPRRFSFHSQSPRDEQTYEWVKDYANTLQSYVNLYPFQWFNFFRSFSTVAEGSS